MARKSKFDRKIVFIEDKYLIGIFDKTPYVCVLKCYSHPEDPSSKVIEGIDMNGRVFYRIYSNNFVYKYTEIIPWQQAKIEHDFIERVFLHGNT